MVNFSAYSASNQKFRHVFSWIVSLFTVCCLMATLCTGILQVASDEMLTDSLDSTFRVYTIGQPRRVDPSRAYDTLSGELIFNVYEPLIAFADKNMLPSSTTNVSAWGYANLSQFEPVLATSLPTISPDLKTWTFTIRPNVKFHPWTMADYSLVESQFLTAVDVEYTFERMLVQDMLGAPSWMFGVPGIGGMFLHHFDNDGTTNTIEPVGVTCSGERLAGSLIDDFVTVEGDNVTFHFLYARPDTYLMQIFAQSWGCVVNKAFCIEHGCWNGTFYDGWSTDYRQMPSNSYSPLDRYYSKSRYSPTDPGPNTGNLGDVQGMCGTGPYSFASWDTTVKVWTIEKFADYWKGWAGQHVDTIVLRGVDVWPTRKMLFFEDGDYISVSSSNMQDLLLPSQLYSPIPGIILYHSAPCLTNDMLRFDMVESTSPYVPIVDGIPRQTFFSDARLRRAFAYSLNYSRYLQDRGSEEIFHPASWWVKGLAPDYENKSLPPFDIDLAGVEEELKVAGVWDSGFEVSLVYSYNSEIRYVYLSMKDSIESLNAKRDGLPPFNITVLGVDWPTYLDLEEQHFLPIYAVGWTADFADPDNFVRPCMHSEYTDICYADYCGGHGGDPYVDELIDASVQMPNNATRQANYEELQFIYMDDVWGIPVAQYLKRYWFKEWVRGFYFNQLYPGIYFYDVYKQVPEYLEPIDISVVD